MALMATVLIASYPDGVVRTRLHIGSGRGKQRRLLVPHFGCLKLPESEAEAAASPGTVCLIGAVRVGPGRLSDSVQWSEQASRGLITLFTLDESISYIHEVQFVPNLAWQDRRAKLVIKSKHTQRFVVLCVLRLKIPRGWRFWGCGATRYISDSVEM